MARRLTLAELAMSFKNRILTVKRINASIFFADEKIVEREMLVSRTTSNAAVSRGLGTIRARFHSDDAFLPEYGATLRALPQAVVQYLAARKREGVVLEHRQQFSAGAYFPVGLVLDEQEIPDAQAGVALAEKVAHAAPADVEGRQKAQPFARLDDEVRWCVAIDLDGPQMVGHYGLLL